MYAHQVFVDKLAGLGTGDGWQIATGSYPSLVGLSEKCNGVYR